MKKTINVADLLKERENLRRNPNKDAEYRKDYDKLSKKIQYYSNTERRKAKNEKDLEHMRLRFKTVEYNEYMRNYMRIYTHKNDFLSVETPQIIF